MAMIGALLAVGHLTNVPSGMLPKNAVHEAYEIMHVSELPEDNLEIFNRTKRLITTEILEDRELEPFLRGFTKEEIHGLINESFNDVTEAYDTGRLSFENGLHSYRHHVKQYLRGNIYAVRH